MPQEKLTAEFVETATSNGKPREFYWDETLPGFGLMVTDTGSSSFVIQYRNAYGVSRRLKINGGKTLAQAKREAKAKLGEVAKGGDPMADKRQQRDASKDTLRKVVEDQYLVDAEIKKLRSFDEKKGTFKRYIFPALGTRPVTEIRRSEIVQMLRKVKATRGHGASNDAFKVLSSFLNWYVPLADDDFRSPIVKGTWSVTKGDGSRTLTDDEIRILWNVTGEGRNAYDHFIRLTLLTATRRNETAEMVRGELSADGTEWTIPKARYKGQDGKIGTRPPDPVVSARPRCAGQGARAPWRVCIHIERQDADQRVLEVQDGARHAAPGGARGGRHRGAQAHRRRSQREIPWPGVRAV